MGQTDRVYILAMLRDGKHCAPVKVGKTARLKDRLSSIQIGSPYELVVAYSVPTGGPSNATKIEQRVHAALKDQRLRGEWFDVEPALAVGTLASIVSGVRIRRPASLHELQALEELYGVTDAYRYCEQQQPGAGWYMSDEECDALWPEIEKAIAAGTNPAATSDYPSDARL